MVFSPSYIDKNLRFGFKNELLFLIRLPDFVIQLQNNMDPHKTLCDVVEHERIILSR